MKNVTTINRMLLLLSSFASLVAGLLLLFGMAEVVRWQTLAIVIVVVVLREFGRFFGRFYRSTKNVIENAAFAFLILIIPIALALGLNTLLLYFVILANFIAWDAYALRDRCQQNPHSADLWRLLRRHYSRLFIIYGSASLLAYGLANFSLTLSTGRSIVVAAIAVTAMLILAINLIRASRNQPKP